MGEQLGFIERLKRHHMFQIAAGYATVAYFLILVANAIFPDIGLSRGQVRYVIAALALGFPLALVFGWLFIKPTQVDAEWHSRWQRLRWRIAPIVAGPAVVLVTISGIYLWHLNGRLEDGAEPGQSAAQVVAILPFDHSGVVDDSFMQGLADQMDTGFSNVGVRLIANDSSPTLSSSKTPVAEIAKATGATLVIGGSVHRDDAKSDYVVHFELISATDGVSLDSLRNWYSGKADPADVQISIASSVAQRVHFLGVLEHYFAPGYPSTKDAGALQLFRRGMLTYLDGDYSNGMQMLRAAVKLDPGFAQAHAYIAFYEAANPEHGVADPKSVVEQELAAAEQKDSGIPEAVMARAARQFYLDEDVAGAIKTLEPVTGQLGNSFNLHMVYGHMLRKSGQMEQAQRQYQAASELDPYNQLAAQHVMRVGLALREYSDTVHYLSDMRDRWPLAIRFYLGQAQLRLSQDGDLAKFAGVVGDDLSSFGVTPKSPMVNMLRLEVAHLQGKHAQVIEGLKSLVMPEEGNCPDPFQMPQLSLQRICVVPFTAESLRLAGKDKEAAAYAKLHVPEFQRLAQKDLSDEMPGAANLALLQAFGGDPASLQSLAPLLKRLDAPVAKWSSEDGIESLDAAAVFAWCGESQKAVDMLAKSFDAPFGAHAALVAIDPVWRPLYKTPAFAALLASHGVALTRAP